jgi:hypothetical protein
VPRPRCERGNFLIANMGPLDLAATTERIGEPVQTVSHDAVDTLHARRLQGLGELICYGSWWSAPSDSIRLYPEAPMVTQQQLIDASFPIATISPTQTCERSIKVEALVGGEDRFSFAHTLRGEWSSSTGALLMF